MIRIIPAIDIIDGKVVRLSRGDFNRSKIYAQNPLAVAKHYADSGIQYLHLVDLDGAKAGHVINQRVLAEITGNTSLSVDFGGGIQSDQDIPIAFDNGARQVTVGSITC